NGQPAGPSETLHGYRVSFPGEWLWYSEGVALLGSVIYISPIITHNTKITTRDLSEWGVKQPMLIAI
ncbi:hypothetical protein, partial [Aeromonas caviae]|uniref:hypothetical protein n=1 Tax=Aeromonas caviae TaxID=648 RepID=UPI001CC4D188